MLIARDPDGKLYIFEAYPKWERDNWVVSYYEYGYGAFMEVTELQAKRLVNGGVLPEWNSEPIPIEQ